MLIELETESSPQPFRAHVAVHCYENGIYFFGDEVGSTQKFSTVFSQALLYALKTAMVVYWLKTGWNDGLKIEQD